MLPVKSVDCPYCGEAIELIIDDSVDHQEYVEDCPVCCRPINVDVAVHGSADIVISCRAEGEA